MIAMSLAAALFVLGGTSAAAKVVILPLVDLVRQAEFIGIVRVERVGPGMFNSPTSAESIRRSV